MSTSPIAQLLLEAGLAEVRAAECYNAAAERFLDRLRGRQPSPNDGDEIMAAFRLKDLASGALDRSRQCVATAEHIRATSAEAEGGSATPPSALPGVGDLS